MDRSNRLWTRSMTLNALKNNLKLLKSVERRLARRRVRSAAVEAEALLRHFGGVNRLDFFIGKKSLDCRAKKAVEGALRIRGSGTPLWYILKKAPFYGHDFFVSKDTLIPRPETELLVEEAIKILDTQTSPRPHVLDIGTGSGCIAVSLTIARPHCKMTALDFSRSALTVARKNIRFKGLEKKIELIQSDLFSSLDGISKGYWDLIVSNPPYIDSKDLRKLPREVRSEPRLALDGGVRGLAVIFRILAQAPAYLRKGGWMILEIGAGQARILKQKIERDGVLKHLRFVKDHAGIDRVLLGQKI